MIKRRTRKKSSDAIIVEKIKLGIGRLLVDDATFHLKQWSYEYTQEDHKLLKSQLDKSTLIIEKLAATILNVGTITQLEEFLNNLDYINENFDKGRFVSDENIEKAEQLIRALRKIAEAKDSIGSFYLEEEDYKIN